MEKKYILFIIFLNACVLYIVGFILTVKSIEIISLPVITDLMKSPQNFNWVSIIEKENLLLTVCSLMVLNIFLYIYIFMDSRGNRANVEHGSAKWNKPLKLKKFKKKKEPGVIISKNIELSLDTKYTRINNNKIILGGSGTGKTRSFVLPNLLQSNSSFVVTDPKGEIFRTTKSFLKKNGYSIKCLDLKEQDSTWGTYNPFKYLRTEMDVFKFAETFVLNTSNKDSKSDEFWEQSIKALFSACVFYLMHEAGSEDQNFAGINKLLEQLVISPGNELSTLEVMFNQLETEKGSDNIAVQSWKTFAASSGDTRNNITISLTVRMNAFKIDKIKNLTNNDTLELDNIGNEKTAVFLKISDTDSSLNFLGAILYSQMFDILVNQADLNERGRLKIPVQFYLDEFANIGQIPGFEELIATVRSRGISMNIILQALSQLKSKYRNSWETIVGNCDGMLFLGSTEQSTLDYVSKKMGKETITVTTHSGKRKENANDGAVGRELLTSDELEKLKYKYLIYMQRSQYPIKDLKLDVSKHSRFKELLIGEIAEEELELDMTVYETDINETFDLEDLELEGSDDEPMPNDDELMTEEEVMELVKTLEKEIKKEN